MFARGMLIALQKMFVLIAMGMLTFLWGVLVSMRVVFVAVRGVLVFLCEMPVLWCVIFVSIAEREGCLFVCVNGSPQEKLNSENIFSFCFRMQISFAQQHFFTCDRNSFIVKSHFLNSLSKESTLRVSNRKPSLLYLFWREHGRERHKSVIRGGTVLRTGCWEDRSAWKLLSARNADEIKAYGYLACGTRHQPDHTFSLVFKKLSFVLADRLYALGLFVTQSPFVPECLVLHPDTRKTQRDREDLREERRHSIQSVLSAMKRQSPTIVSFEGLPHEI